MKWKNDYNYLLLLVLLLWLLENCLLDWQCPVVESQGGVEPHLALSLVFQPPYFLGYCLDEGLAKRRMVE